MKILLLGDASNFHNSLACGLRRLGHDVVVASDGSRWQNTHRDIDISRGEGLWGAVGYVAKLMRLLPKMRGYDVVHLVNPIFVQLKPERVRVIFDYLKRHNRSVMLTVLGLDYEVVKANMAGDVLDYTEFNINHEPTGLAIAERQRLESGGDSWLTERMRRHHSHIIDRIDGAVACLYEYYKIYKNIIPHKLAYAGIPIDTEQLKPQYIENEPDKVRFFIGLQRGRIEEKGLDRMHEAMKQVAARYPDKCTVDVVQNVPYAEYVERMRSSHVLLDQLYSYTPATNALIAMAQGMVAVSGAEDEYYDFIGESACRPIINVSPLVEGDIYRKLEWLVLNKSQLPQLSRMSREFVMKHNDSVMVAQRHLDFWNKIFTEKNL